MGSGRRQVRIVALRRDLRASVAMFAIADDHAAGDSQLPNVGVVVIGRNEGIRLERCLRSIARRVGQVVYVDSGSTDGSVVFAQSLNVNVVELDMSLPFTAARARNVGLKQLLERSPRLEFVQFVDGDCEIEPGWLDTASNELDRRPEVAVVCGRLRERNRDASIYNRLCDLEWDRPPGPIKSCGGVAMVRVSALREVGGFRDDLICGEEPELCLRMRSQGWQIVRLADEMAWHDAAMSRFKQWWMRAVRSGYSTASLAWLHGSGPERFSLRQSISSVFWGFALPLLCGSLLHLTAGLSLLLMLGYTVLWMRVLIRERSRGRSRQDSLLSATFVIIGKPAESLGVALFCWRQITRSAPCIIEYKLPTPG